MIGKQQAPRPRHLGRGLESLLGPQGQQTPFTESQTPEPLQPLRAPPEQQAALIEISLDAISPNPYQARRHWDQDKLAELADSIQASGLVQPVSVRKVGSGYQLIAGERRFRAFQLLGRETIPAIVRQTSDAQQLEWSLVENIHRDDLNPIDRAKAYQAYLNAFSTTQAEAAARLGEDGSVISNHLRLLDLPQELQQMLINGDLAMGHARAIVALPTDELRRKLANKAMARRLSVREVERLVRRYLTDSRPLPDAQTPKLPHISEMESRIGTALGVRVKIDLKRNGRQGKLIIEFRSLDDFDRITEKLGVSSQDQP
jgi:ParB family transcriptional regulator, chromosome partitioning protein